MRWGHLSPYQLKNRFAFMVSRRQAEELRARLAAGQKIVLKARVRAKMVPATYDVVVADDPGTDRATEEVVLTAHLCHQSAGANDNASGSAAILEVARALQAGIAKGTLPKPRRTIRFLWLPEIAGSQAYLIRHPEIARRLAAGIHMDMVGGLLATTHATLHISRSAESLPHVVNEIAGAFFEEVHSASAGYAEQGATPGGCFVWPSARGSLFWQTSVRSRWEATTRFSRTPPSGSRWSTSTIGHVFIHTNKDLPENLDATKLGRVAYMGAGIAWTLAALPDPEAARLVELASAEASARIARASLKRRDPDGGLFRREAVAAGIETQRSIAALWPGAAPDALTEESRLRALETPSEPASSPRDARVPERSAEVRGPLDVYYYQYLAEHVGPGAKEPDPALARRENGDVLAFEALNLADGKRTISQIRDILAGRYAPVPLTEVSAYFELLLR